MEAALLGFRFRVSLVGEVRMWARAVVMHRLDWGWKVKMMTHSHGHWPVVTMGASL